MANAKIVYSGTVQQDSRVYGYNYADIQYFGIRPVIEILKSNI